MENFRAIHQDCYERLVRELSDELGIETATEYLAKIYDEDVETWEDRNQRFISRLSLRAFTRVYPAANQQIAFISAVPGGKISEDDMATLRQLQPSAKGSFDEFVTACYHELTDHYLSKMDWEGPTGGQAPGYAAVIKQLQNHGFLQITDNDYEAYIRNEAGSHFFNDVYLTNRHKLAVEGVEQLDRLPETEPDIAKECLLSEIRYVDPDIIIAFGKRVFPALAEQNPEPLTENAPVLEEAGDSEAHGHAYRIDVGTGAYLIPTIHQAARPWNPIIGGDGGPSVADLDYPLSVIGN